MRGLAVLALAVPHRVLSLWGIPVETLELLDTHCVQLSGALLRRDPVWIR
jgi:hypothetical protein